MQVSRKTSKTQENLATFIVGYENPNLGLVFF